MSDAMVEKMRAVAEQIAVRALAAEAEVSRLREVLIGTQKAHRMARREVAELQKRLAVPTPNRSVPGGQSECKEGER